MSLSIDHIVLCVDDLEAAAVEVQRRFGLGSTPGGSHGGLGTANRIVPLGSSYLELVAVLDSEEAASSTFGSWVAARASRVLQPHAVCLSSDELDSICERLGLVPVSMSRTRPDGYELRWRLAGLDDMIARGTPFYIEWDIDPSDHPARTATPAQATVEATLTGDREFLARWTAGCRGIYLQTGKPGVASVKLRLPEAVFSL